jgi:hypothetical protein
MKRHILTLLVLPALAVCAFAQQWPVPTPSIGEVSYVNGVYYAPNFGLWSLKLASAITSGSTTSFTVNKGFVATPDGIVFSPFRANEKIWIGTGILAEIATVSAVSNCNLSALDGSTPICTVTISAATTNSHSPGEAITSADSGIMEAIGYAENAVGTSSNGIAQGAAGGGVAGGQVYFAVDCGATTLATGSLTTTTACFVPNQFYNQGSASRVTTTITTSANWSVGVAGANAAFSAANSTLTAGTTAYAVEGTPAAVLATGATAPGLTAVLYTMGTSNPGAGAIKSKVWGYVAVQPAF